MDETPLVRVHQVEDLVAARLLDLAGHLLGVVAEIFFLPLPEEFAVHLDLLVGDFVEDVLKGQKQSPVLPQEKLLILAAEDDKDEVVLPLDLIRQIEGEHRLELFEESRDLVIPRRGFGPSMDDDLLADPKELGLLSDDLVVELRAQDLQLMLGVADGLVEVLALEFRKRFFGGFSFFFVFHGIQPSWLSSCGS